MCMYVKPECAVCMCDSNYLAYTSQIWPDKKDAFLIV